MDYLLSLMKWCPQGKLGIYHWSRNESVRGDPCCGMPGSKGRLKQKCLNWVQRFYVCCLQPSGGQGRRRALSSRLAHTTVWESISRNKVIFLPFLLEIASCHAHSDTWRCFISKYKRAPPSPSQLQMSLSSTRETCTVYLEHSCHNELSGTLNHWLLMKPHSPA